MPILGREILEERQPETKEIEVPEWGGSILIRKLSASEATKYMAFASSVVDTTTKRITDPERLVRMMAQTLVWSWVNEQGGQVLTNADIERICREPYDTLDRITDDIRAFNGLGQTATEEAKKNSEPTTSDDFGIN